MLGMMAARAATGAVSAATKNGTPANEVKPTPCHPFAVAVVLGLMAVVIGAAMANGGQVTAIITPIAIISGFVILGGMFAAGASGAHRTNQALKAMPNPEDSLHEAQQFRAAMERRAARTEAQPDAPREPAPLDAKVIESRPVVTLSSLRKDAEDTERCTRVAQIITAACPVCAAEGATACTLQAGQEVTILDRDRGVIVHDERIGHAIKTRTANIADVKAQFNDNIPLSVLQSAL